MKTLFFSAMDISNIDVTNSAEDDTNSFENVKFNTHHILNPHEVLSAIKVRYKGFLYFLLYDFTFGFAIRIPSPVMNLLLNLRILRLRTSNKIT